MNHINGASITEDMVKLHAKMHDSEFMGALVLIAMGIRGACLDFCQCNAPEYEKNKYYNLFWMTDSGYDTAETFHIDEIMEKLGNLDIAVKKTYGHH